MFDCAATIADSPTLTYKLSGTNLKNYKLSASTVSITGEAKTDKKTGDDAKVTWAFSKDTSTAP